MQQELSTELKSISIEKHSTEGVMPVKDVLAVEEPLEISIAWGKKGERKENSVSVTMRTPGNDAELAAGFLFTEGIIEKAGELVGYSEAGENKITVELSEDIFPDMERLKRNFYTTSSCGVCGKSSIESIQTLKRNSGNSESINTISASVLQTLPSRLRDRQSVFEQTGGLHASALFTTEGELILLKEDVGRHNALDKLIGSALQRNLLPLDDCLLLLSGRASFELIQKAAMADIKFVAAIGAPSSLAVSLAAAQGMTLIGFLRSDRFNVYCGSENVRRL